MSTRQFLYLYALMSVVSVKAGGWREYDPNSGYVRITNEGNESLIEFNMNASPINDSLFPFRFFDGVEYKRAYIEFAGESEKLRDLDCISLDVFAEKKDRAAIWFEVTQVNGKWAAATWPLRPREWNTVHLGLSNYTPEERTMIKGATFGITAMGRLPGDCEWAGFRVRNLRFGRLPSRTEKSWQTTTMGLTRLGFPADAERKQAVLPLELLGHDFSLRGRNDNSMAYSGKISEMKSALGQFAVADFSAFKEEGVYRLEINGDFSPEIVIGPHIYRVAADQGMNYLNSIRSGTATPAHPLCFTDDAIREDTREHVDVSGGWFDASDLRGYYSMAITNVMRMMTFAARLNPYDTKAQSEADWGAAHYNKLWDKETGFPFTGLKLYPTPEQQAALGRNFYKANNFWTDNQVNTPDDRVLHVPWKSNLCHLDIFPFHAGIVSAGANYALLGRDSIDEQKYLDHFEKLYDPDRFGDYKVIPDLGRRNRTGNRAMLLETAAVGKKFITYAEELTKELFSRQELRYFSTAHGKLGGYMKEFASGEIPFQPTLAHEMPILALLIFAGNPDICNKLYGDIILRSAIYGNFFVKTRRSLTAPYFFPFDLITVNGKDGVILGERLDGSHLSAKFNRSFLAGFAGSQSLEAQFLATILADPELEQAAEEMLRWQFGNNPFGVNLMVGVGGEWKEDIMSTHLGFIPGMMGNIHFPDKVNPELPIYRHYTQNEIYSQSHGPFQAALSLQIAPRVVKGQVAQASAKDIRINGLAVKTDQHGKFQAAIEGDGHYEVKAGSQVLLRGYACRGIKNVGVLDPATPVDLTSLRIDRQRDRMILEAENYSEQALAVTLDFTGIGVEAEIDRQYVMRPGTNRIEFEIRLKTAAETLGGALVNLKNNRKNFVYAFIDN